MRVLKYRKTDRGQRLSSGRHAQKGERVKTRITRGDTVRVVRGDDKGKEGKVLRVHLKTGRVTIEGVNRTRAASSTCPPRSTSRT